MYDEKWIKQLFAWSFRQSACVEICVDADRQADRQTDRRRYRVQDGSWPNHRNGYLVYIFSLNYWSMTNMIYMTNLFDKYNFSIFTETHVPDKMKYLIFSTHQSNEMSDRVNIKTNFQWMRKYFWKRMPQIFFRIVPHILSMWPIWTLWSLWTTRTLT